MDLRLISSDRDLCRLCREILSSLGRHDWTLSVTQQRDSLIDADLYVWDFAPGLSVPIEKGYGSKHLFLVSQEDFQALQATVGDPEANILLKPVTRSVLAAFLALAFSAHEEGLARTSALRAHRDDMLQCLIQANLRLQEYDQFRTNFLVRAVHDFRAPLTALTGYCSLLLSGALGELSQDQSEVMRRMQHSAKRLSRMADAMFELGVKDRVKRRPDFQQGDLVQCIEQAVHEIKPFAIEKRIVITVDVSAPGAALYFEPGQMEQLLINLLDNACKFAPKGGSIVIRGYPFFQERRDERLIAPISQERRSHMSSEPNSFRLDLRDSGSRIPEEYLGKIFEEYTSYAGKNDRSGGGLGLAICRMIVSQHEGRIWAQNTETGPMFSFTLPLRTEPQRPGEHEAKVHKEEVVRSL
jgi:signal transduction histidine kinase